MCWAHPTEHLWRVHSFGGYLDYHRCLGAIPVKGAIGVPLRRIRLVKKVLAPAYKTLLRVTMISGTMSNVHATYPCMGGGSSHR